MDNRARPIDFWAPRIWGPCSVEHLAHGHRRAWQEAALYVLRTHSSEDAVRIFTEGLKPVLGVRKTSMADSEDEDDDGNYEDDDSFNPDAFPDDDSFCHHRHQYGGRADEERDVATAPF